MGLFQIEIPPGLYQVSYTVDGSLCPSIIPACGLENAREQAKDRCERFKVKVFIEGIGPEKGFLEVIEPPQPIFYEI